MTTTTTTTKYELTDADRERLDAIAQKASGKPKVDDIAWAITRYWFATLPVVSREAAERALGEATSVEIEAFNVAYGNGYPDMWGAWRRGLNAVLVDRRHAMLDDATIDPPKVEPVLAEDDLRKRLDWQIREIVRERGERVRANRDGDVGNRIHWGVASAMTSLYDSLFPRSLDDDLGWSEGFGSNAVEPTPEPQPAIDVVAELAELRKNADRCLATLGAHRSQLDDTIATIGLMLESQDAQRDVNKIHAQRLDTLNLRVTDLEFAAQRKPWWRWW